MAQVEQGCAICGNDDCQHTDEEVAEHMARLEAGVEPLVIASDAGAVARRARTLKRDADDEVADLKWLMGHKQGRRFVWRLLARCGIYESSYAKAAGDLAAMAFAEGQRNIGLAYMADLLKYDVERYQLMVSENGGKS